MNEFKNYHPVVNFIYFFALISFSMATLNPVCLIISFVCSILYSCMLNGRKAIKFNVFFLVPVIFFAALFNPLFNHKGATILAYFPSGNPLTLESVLCGITTGLMLAAVMGWFSCFNAVITSDKFIYLFGKISPSVSLVLSMTLRFIPRFKEQFKITMDAQKNFYDAGKKTYIKRMVKVFSSMLTWSFENAAETSKSMRARGYGLEKRSFFSVFKFTKKDFFVLFFIIAASAYVLSGFIFGVFSFAFYPKISGFDFKAYDISCFSVFFILNIIPVFIEFTEVITWRLLKRKI